MGTSEKNRKRWSWFTAIAVQLVMLLLFYFLVAWREPFPPIPSYGIELGFVSNVSQPQKAAPMANPVEDQVEEQADETRNEPITEEVIEEVIVEESNEIVEDYIDEESPVDVTETVIEETAEPVEPTLEEPMEPIKEDPKPIEEKTVPEVSQTKESDTGTDAQTIESIPTLKPTLDNRAIYGSTLNPGDQGASLQLAGWSWDSRPTPKDQSNESGKIEYEIKVDSDGYLVDIKLISSTVSPSVERLYKESIERLSFSKTNDYKPASLSTGRVTFIITTK